MFIQIFFSSKIQFIIKFIGCLYVCNWIKLCANFISSLKDKIKLLKAVKNTAMTIGNN